MPEQRRLPPFRILLDENVDRLLKSHFHPDFEVATVPEQGWAGTSDRERRSAAACRWRHATHRILLGSTGWRLSIRLPVGRKGMNNSMLR